MIRRSFLAGLAALAPLRAAAQGYPGLGAARDGFARPDPATRLAFPRDHLPHPAFRTEWWYLTANLADAEGRPWGAQWTLFRYALDPAAPEAQAWMGHAALTDARHQRSAERFGRPGQAGVTAEGAGIAAWIDEWRLVGAPETGLRISAGGRDFAYEFAARATGPLVLQGENGFSLKSTDGTASHYYSQPFMGLAGRAETAAGAVDLSGIGWLDREWSSDPLGREQQGWDWFALSFAGGAKLMAYVLRGPQPYRSGTWIEADGSARPLPQGAFAAQPLQQAAIAGRSLPIAWRLTLPAEGVDIEIRAVNPDAWMPMVFPYWEGPVAVTGSHPGRGYLEMTGY